MGYFIDHQDAISVKEAAEKYNYHPQTIRNWIDKKRVRSLKVNRRFYLYETDLKAYINWIISC